MRVWSLPWEDPLEEGVTTPAFLPWIKEPGGLEPVVLQRVGCGWDACTHRQRQEDVSSALPNRPLLGLILEKGVPVSSASSWKESLDRRLSRRMGRYKDSGTDMVGSYLTKRGSKWNVIFGTLWRRQVEGCMDSNHVNSRKENNVGQRKTGWKVDWPVTTSAGQEHTHKDIQTEGNWEKSD